MNTCSTCADAGRVLEVFDEGFCFRPCHDPERGQPCPDCRECARCAERFPEGDFERPYPEDESLCLSCVDDVRNYAGRDGENDHLPNFDEAAGDEWR